MKVQSTFLDKQTLFALAIVFLSWFLWEKHMRAKYKKEPQKTPVQLEQVQEKFSKQETKKFLKRREKILNFEDDNWEIQFSSQGMGVKYLKLKKFLDRKNNPVQFQSLPSDLLFEIRSHGEILFFDMDQDEERRIVGKARNGKIQVTIGVQDYSLSYQVEVKNKALSALEVQTINLPLEGARGLIQGLLSGKEPGLSLFVSTVKEKQKRILYSKEKTERLTLDQTEMIGLGGRYFGQAFLNLSDILPQLQFHGNPKVWQTRLEFVFPKTGETSVLKYKTFFGPKSVDQLKRVDPRLVSWINFGFLSSLAKIILSFLKMTFLITNNWGLSIILLTILVRVFLFPLNLSAYRSMKVMKKLQPEIQALRKKYKGNVKTMNEQMLVLMKRSKARPLGGCVPMLLQFPIFFALYRVLGESFELYRSPFFGWIADLSLKDPFYILPVLMGISMYLQQKMTPTNMDPLQEKMLRILPVIFTFFMINLPSGLNLYILVSTLFGLVQQYYFTRTDS